MIFDWTSLPISVGGELLGKWLEMQDVVHFDTACVGYDRRTTFLQYCSNTTYSYEIAIKSSSQMYWIAQRGFRLVDIDFTDLDWSDRKQWRTTLHALRKILSAKKMNMKRIKIGCFPNVKLAAQFVTIVVKYSQNILHVEMTFDVDDAAAAVLFNSLRLIQSIVINNCNGFTSSSFPFLKSAELSELYLCCLPSLTDDALLAISHNCPNLRVLDVSICGKIGHKGVIAMLRSCPLLEEVHLSEMPASVVTAVANVLATGQHCALQLRALTIDKLSTTELRAILAKYLLLSKTYQNSYRFVYCRCSSSGLKIFCTKIISYR